MNLNRTIAALLFGSIAMTSVNYAQTLGARTRAPNTESNVDTRLRYRPDGADFVIENGSEFFNRALYGGNTAFRVDAGDKPEFVLYLPGRGGNLRMGIRNPDGQNAKWLHAAQSIIARYRPGGMIYEIRDPLLGSNGSLQIEAYALPSPDGLIVQVQGHNIPEGLELLWAFGGANGQRGKRDGDIGTESVPISEYFQLKPEFCEGNTFETSPGRFTLTCKPGRIVGCVGAESDPKPEIADADKWNDPNELFAVTNAPSAPKNPVVVGRLKIKADEKRYLAVQRATEGATTFSAGDLPKAFTAADAHFKQLRQRVMIDTPDPFINAAVGAMNVAADAAWDEPQKAIMHGAIAWRVKLLGWRGPYSLDALGWHDRARANIEYWISRQNTKPVPDTHAPPDEDSNLARSEAALHTNGDMSNSHYDMNLVFIDALFRHLLWTGDREFAAKVWPAIERHLAWERRNFRREYGPEKLPLYEAYAAIWASDDLYYHGGGATHATAYNHYHNKMAAKIARLIGKDPEPYQREADLILRAMREYLWLSDEGHYAEYRDLLGRQLAHPNAAIWTVYHTTDSEAVSPVEAWQLSRYVDRMPHIPVRGPGVPSGDGNNGYAILPTSTWMPYSWSINNVCMNENAHMALSYWQSGRTAEGFRLLKSSLLASMYMGIAPGNVGTMTYLDVYRRESQRDFADASGTLSRAMVEGLFGVLPDALAGELHIKPGFPAEWNHASFKHPRLAYSWKRTGQTDSFMVESTFGKPMSLCLAWPAYAEDVAEVTVNGAAARWEQNEQAIGKPSLVITTDAGEKWEINIRWKGSSIAAPEIHARTSPGFVPVKQGAFSWLMPAEVQPTPPAAASIPATDWSKPPIIPSEYESVDLTKLFNLRVTEIFKQEYRSPRSPHVSLAIPKQGIGAWAGHVNATANIDDTGLRESAAKSGGKLLMPNGVPFHTPAATDAPNIVFTSQWDIFPKEIAIPLNGKSKHLYLLMAGSTNWMQSRFDNGEVVVTYADGSTERLALNNPINWWPIDQDYFIDDYQFHRPEAIPPRVDLKTGKVRLLDVNTFKGKGGAVDGGAATALDLPLDPSKELKSLTVRTIANDVVIGLMSATLER